MRLIGAREFLKTAKPGDLYYRYWCSRESACEEVIDDILERGATDIYAEIEIFGDNSGSLSFTRPVCPDTVCIDGKEYDCFFYYDANVVGDAGPTTTLYLVFDNLNEWPERVKIEGTEDEFLTKEELIKFREHFINECGPFTDEANDGWALKKLDEDYYRDNWIVNYSKRLGE